MVLYRFFFLHGILPQKQAFFKVGGEEGGSQETASVASVGARHKRFVHGRNEKHKVADVSGRPAVRVNYCNRS